MSFLATYPAGSVVTWATLNISFREHYSNFPDDKGKCRPLFWYTFCAENVRWRIFAAIFGLALGAIPIANQRPSLWGTISLPDLGCNAFDARFFRDSSRSCHHTVNNHHQTAVAEQLLSFLTHRTIPLYPSSLSRILRWKDRPRFTRRRKSIPSASYSSELIKFAKCWWSRKYLRLLFPDETAKARKAINGYLLRVSGNNGYISPLNFIFRSRY